MTAHAAAGASALVDGAADGVLAAAFAVLLALAVIAWRTAGTTKGHGGSGTRAVAVAAAAASPSQRCPCATRLSLCAAATALQLTAVHTLQCAAHWSWPFSTLLAMLKLSAAMSIAVCAAIGARHHCHATNESVQPQQSQCSDEKYALIDMSASASATDSCSSPTATTTVATAEGYPLALQRQLRALSRQLEHAHHTLNVLHFCNAPPAPASVSSPPALARPYAFTSLPRGVSALAQLKHTQWDDQAPTIQQLNDEMAKRFASLTSVSQVDRAAAISAAPVPVIVPAVAASVPAPSASSSHQWAASGSVSPVLVASLLRDRKRHSAADPVSPPLMLRQLSASSRAVSLSCASVSRGGDVVSEGGMALSFDIERTASVQGAQGAAQSAVPISRRSSPAPTVYAAANTAAPSTTHAPLSAPTPSPISVPPPAPVSVAQVREVERLLLQPVGVELFKSFLAGSPASPAYPHCHPAAAVLFVLDVKRAREMQPMEQPKFIANIVGAFFPHLSSNAGASAPFPSHVVAGFGTVAAASPVECMLPLSADLLARIESAMIAWRSGAQSSQASLHVLDALLQRASLQCTHWLAAMHYPAFQASPFFRMAKMCAAFADAITVATEDSADGAAAVAPRSEAEAGTDGDQFTARLLPREQQLRPALNCHPSEWMTSASTSSAPPSTAPTPKAGESHFHGPSASHRPSLQRGVSAASCTVVTNGGGGGSGGGSASLTPLGMSPSFMGGAGPSPDVELLAAGVAGSGLLLASSDARARMLLGLRRSGAGGNSGGGGGGSGVVRSMGGRPGVPHSAGGGVSGSSSGSGVLVPSAPFIPPTPSKRNANRRMHPAAPSLSLRSQSAVLSPTLLHTLLHQRHDSQYQSHCSLSGPVYDRLASDRQVQLPHGLAVTVGSGVCGGSPYEVDVDTGDVCSSPSSATCGGHFFYPNPISPVSNDQRMISTPHSPASVAASVATGGAGQAFARGSVAHSKPTVSFHLPNTSTSPPMHARRVGDEAQAAVSEQAAHTLSQMQTRAHWDASVIPTPVLHAVGGAAAAATAAAPSHEAARARSDSPPRPAVYSSTRPPAVSDDDGREFAAGPFAHMSIPEGASLCEHDEWSDAAAGDSLAAPPLVAVVPATTRGAVYAHSAPRAVPSDSPAAVARRIMIGLQSHGYVTHLLGHSSLDE